MSWQSDIVTAILADAGLSALIGTRIYADVADGSATVPYLVYQQVSSIGETPLDGVRSVTFPLVQFSCWDDTKAGAIDVASKLKTAIEGKNLPGGNNVSLGYVNSVSTRDQQTKLYGEQVDYRVSCDPN